MKNKKRISLVWMITLIISIVSILSISVSPQNEFSMELTSRTGNFSFSAPENVSRFMALESLITAEAEIKSMQDYDLPTNYLNDILLLGKRSYIGEKFSYLKQDLEKEEDRKKISYLEGLQTLSFATPGHEIEYQNLSKVLFLTGLISFRKDQAFRILDYLPVVEEKENLFTEKGVNTTDGMNQLILARTAFKEERYDEAEALLDQADSLLESAYFEHQRSTAILSIGKNFFIRYWWQIILVLVVIAVLFRPVFRKARRSMAASKLERLKLEFDTLQESLRKAQEERFIERTMTARTYELRSDTYLSRMAKIKHTIPLYEAIAKGQEDEHSGIISRIKNMLYKKGWLRTKEEREIFNRKKEKLKLAGKKQELPVFETEKPGKPTNQEKLSEQPEPKAEPVKQVKQPEPVKPKKPLFGAFVNGVGAAGTSLSRSLSKSLSSFGSGVKKHSARVWKYSKELDSKVIDKSESFLKSIKNAFPAQKPVKPADQEELISRMGKKPVRKPGVIEVIEPKKIEWEKPQKAKKSLFPIISKSIMSAGRSAAHKIKEHSMKGLALSKKFDNYLLSKIKESYQKSKKSISKISIPKIPRGPGPVKPSVQQPQKAAVEPEKEKAIERVKWIDVHKDVQEKLQKEKQNKIEKEKSRKLREKRMQEFSSRIKDNVSKALSFSEKLDQDVIRIARDYYTKSKDFLAKGIAPSRKMSNHKKRMAELHAQREKEHKNMLMKEKKELQATLAKERQQKIMMAKFHQQHNAQQARKGKESWNRSISKAKSLISSVSSRSASAAARIKKNLLNLESSGIAKAKQEKRIVAKIIHDDEEKMHTYFRRLKKRTVSSGSAGAASIKAASRSSKRTYDNLALKAKSILKRYSRKAKDIESSMIEEIKPKKRSFLKKKR